jgi:uncharacterized cupredoxin-like copper-binding protein
MSLINLVTVAKVVMGTRSRLGWVIALSALMLGLLLGVTACAEQGGLGDSEQEPREEAASPVPEDTPTTEVGLTEYQIEMPTSLSAGSQTFRVTNNGTTEHNFEVEGQGIEEAFETNLSPGETQTMQLDLAPGTYEVYCPVATIANRGWKLS